MSRASETAPPGEVTRQLRAARDGGRDGFDALFALVYDELRTVARQQLRGAQDAAALHTTELVHELYVKLVDQPRVDWESRAHFYGAAARAMRQILIDLARRRKAAKRGGDWTHTTLTGQPLTSEVELDEMLALEELLAQLDERQRQVVEYRFYGGMSEDEIARVLGVSTRTVRRDWIKARASLHQALYATAP